MNKQTTQAHRYREQTGGCQRGGGVGVGNMGEGGQKVQNSILTSMAQLAGHCLSKLKVAS